MAVPLGKNAESLNFSQQNFDLEPCKKHEKSGQKDANNFAGQLTSSLLSSVVQRKAVVKNSLKFVSEKIPSKSTSKTAEVTNPEVSSVPFLEGYFATVQ